MGHWGIYPELEPYDMLRLETAGYRDRAMVAINARLQAGSTNIYRAVWAYEFPLFGGVMAWYTGGDLPFIFLV